MARITPQSRNDGSGGPLCENRLVAVLPSPERQHLLDATTNVTLHGPTVLFEPGGTADGVYFPTDGVVALVTPLQTGAVIGVATIGNEGVVGVPLVDPLTSFAVRAITQVAGHALRLETSVFAELVADSDTFQTLIERYTQALYGQIALAAACNRLHSSEERLSRWLLTSQDRVQSDEFEMTQEFLAQMLGARRSTVAISTGILQRAGLVNYTRGHVTIVDREGLEAVSCECYALIKAQLYRVPGEQP
jgi:CRP-like cAMP-binding protein